MGTSGTLALASVVSKARTSGESHGDESFIWGSVGRIENTLNSIRSQLGADYGQRLSYIGFNDNNSTFIPFDSKNKNHIYNYLKDIQEPSVFKLGFIHPREGKYIKY